MSKLSQHIGELIFNNIPWSWEWQIICQTQNYSPISNRCDLCLNEKYYIMYHNEYASLNMKSELFGYCRHKESHLLLKVKTWLNEAMFYCYLIYCFVVFVIAFFYQSPDDCLGMKQSVVCGNWDMWNILL